MPEQPLLTKDAINIGGHKFPIALVGGLAAVATVLLVLRARSKGTQVASVGAAPATDLTGFSGAGVAGQADAAALANLQQQLGALQNSLSTQTPPAPAQAPLPPSSLLLTGTAPLGVPVWSYNQARQGILGWLPSGTVEGDMGVAPGFAGGEPGWLVDFGGQQGWISGGNVAGASGLARAAK